MIEKTKKDIIEYLNKLKELVRKGSFRIEMNMRRGENLALFRMYALKRRDIDRILLSLLPGEFVKAVENEHEAFREEELYVFGPKRVLLNRRKGIEETVQLYLKTNLLENKMVIVVSCHKAKYPLKPYFTEEP